MSNQKVIMSPLNSQNPVFRVLLVFLQLKVVPSVTLLSSSRPTLYNNINNEHMCYNIITQYNTLIIHFTLTSALPHWMQRSLWNDGGQSSLIRSHRVPFACWLSTKIWRYPPQPMGGRV